MFGKKLLIALIVLLFGASVFSQSYNMRDLGTNFQGYLCSKIGGTSPASSGTNFDVTIQVGEIARPNSGCIDSLFICWFEGFCGIKPVTDVWGITSIVITPSKALKVSDTKADIVVNLKNFKTNEPVTGTIESYIYDTVLGQIVAGTQTLPKSITIPANGNHPEPFSYILSSADEGKSYQFVAKLQSLPNDNVFNNTGSETFSVFKTQQALTVPDNNLFLVALVAFSVLAIVSFKK